MEIAVISDLHLGPGDKSDLFGHDDAEFIRFLRHLESSFERIVLLGDIWETLTGPLPFSPRHALERSKDHHREIATRFERPKYTYVHGNHDIVAAALGVPEHYDVEADGVRLHFMHGHTHDLLLRKARWLSEVAVYLGGWLCRLGLAPVYGIFQHLDDWATSAMLDPSKCTFQRWAIQHAARREADVVITGHTHLPASTAHGSRLFLNSGSCSHGNTTFLAIDTKRDTYQVCHSW